MPIASPITPLERALGEEAARVAGVTDATAVLEPPANPGFGDLATNVAMTLAKAAGRGRRLEGQRSAA
ncbi:MAG: hypothetical protein ACPHET_06170, partial [Miltoncostaeaceae bacterium]